jgi:hypothetical protein
MEFSPSNLLSGVNPQPHEPAPKRQKMSSVTSESTLAGETLNVTTGGQISCSVASEDLFSMMFHVADLQRVTNSWALHHPLIGAEAEMKAPFKAYEDTTNSLRDTIESLEVNATSLARAYEFGAAVRDLHESTKENDMDDGKKASANEARCVYPLWSIDTERWQSVRAADTLKFLVKTGIGKIVTDEFASLAKFEGTFKDLTYNRWYQQRVQTRDDIMKAMDQDPEPLVDFKDKVKRHFQRDLMERVIGDFKRGLEGQ